MPEPENGRALPLWLTVVLGVAGAAGALWGISTYSGIVAPTLLAFVLTVTASPLVGVLVRRGVRRGFAVAVTVVLVNGGLIAFAVALVVSVGQLATVLPQYSDEWEQWVDDVRGALAAAGVGREQVEQMVSSLSLSSVVSAVGGLLAGVASAVGALVLVLATVLFMSADAAGTPERLATVPGTWRLRAAFGDFARNTRRYLVVTTIFGFAVAVVDYVALVLLGVPLALLWGLLSFLTNYVPNIGFFLGLAPPALLALLDGGPRQAVLVVLVYTVANFVLQSVIQPVVVGDAVGLSVTLTFLSVIVWTVVLGPLGAILAIPLTLFLVALLVGQDPERRWARVLLAGASGAGSPEKSAGSGRGRRRAGEGVPAPAPRSSAADDDRAVPDGPVSGRAETQSDVPPAPGSGEP
ncbi:AI-2E family transporter [Geodermatophilus sabuli]|uniref:Predicted PurR-regulated permease PerM n=1 Tax=Geodermatophilus sabuli TaxID=1564158 RepID=A0A285EDV9_9ACTN|nr:AI-2E family transporter [Geodermatophilus sabuli]MBB3084506.1 putative PurR-regulated permease PerM [Geodermatophilus sabuli]SNX97299.1 Predicted PurR-regulated permease PerM [Geodermatophilus sabuli]